MTTIPKGYQIHVTTWENDGDNYKTKIISGLTGAKVKMLYQLAKFFESGTNNNATGPDGRGNYGNADNSYDSHGGGSYHVHFNSSEFEKEFLEFCEKHNIDSEDFHEETFFEIIGTWCEGEYIRVMEKVEVYYVPEEITPVSITQFEV